MPNIEDFVKDPDTQPPKKKGYDDVKFDVSDMDDEGKSEEIKLDKVDKPVDAVTEIKPTEKAMEKTKTKKDETETRKMTMEKPTTEGERSKKGSDAIVSKKHAEDRPIAVPSAPPKLTQPPQKKKKGCCCSIL